MMHSKTEALSFKTATCMVNSDAIETTRGSDSFRLVDIKLGHIAHTPRVPLAGSMPCDSDNALSVESCVLSV